MTSTIICPYCGARFNANAADTLGEYETDADDDGFFVSRLCPECGEYVGNKENKKGEPQ